MWGTCFLAWASFDLRLGTLWACDTPGECHHAFLQLHDMQEKTLCYTTPDLCENKWMDFDHKALYKPCNTETIMQFKL